MRWDAPLPFSNCSLKLLKIKQLSYVSYFCGCKVTTFFETYKVSALFFHYFNFREFEGEVKRGA